MSPAAPVVKRCPVGRRELFWLAGAILMGAVLRLSFPGRMAIEHFDEGVYASNFWFGAEDGYEYPARHLYAPPLLPALIEWTMITVSLCGVRPTGFIPMIPCLIAGLATIPSIWWVGRRWFGPAAGVVAAWLVALSDFHASYSRAALTDVPVCLFILWGVYFLKQALQSGSRRDLVLASLFTSLAWWTKYNGWLPLAVGLSGGLAWQLMLPRAERQVAMTSRRWLIVAGLSCLVWSPVLIGLQQHGGYSEVAANHRQYVGGLNQWRSAALRQLLSAGVYDNWLGVPYEMWVVSLVSRIESTDPNSSLSPVLAMDFVNPSWISDFGQRANSAGVVSSVESLLATTEVAWTFVLATPLLLLLASVSGCLVGLLTDRLRQDKASVWFLLAWIVGLCVATPFYHPYPRLILPLMMAIWLGIGLLAQLVFNAEPLHGSDAADQRSIKRERLGWGFAVCLVGCFLIRCRIGTANVWQDRSDLASRIEAVIPRIQQQTIGAGYPGDEAIVYVRGEPAVVFALKGSGLPFVAPIQSVDRLATSQPRPAFLITPIDGTSLDESESLVTVVPANRSHLTDLDQADWLNRPIRRQWALRIVRLP